MEIFINFFNDFPLEKKSNKVQNKKREKKENESCNYN